MAVTVRHPQSTYGTDVISELAMAVGIKPFQAPSPEAINAISES